jgi:hypothetical protein
MRISILALALGLALSGCDNWPLYLHLPDPDLPIPVPWSMDYAEDPAVPDDQVQDVGDLTPPAIVTITGRVETCGYDLAAEVYEWPQHASDANEDGQPDGFEARSGWYTGDLDLFGFEARGDGWLEASLEWTHAPSGGVNAPWRPAEPEGDWASESDLDFVVFDLGVIASDAGVSRAHPESTAQVLFIESGTDRVLGVACHHELPTDYVLTLYLRNL